MNQEALAINKSLTCLGNVITALGSGATHIPYKENILTRIMQDSLGGTAKTLMFVNCGPSVYNEAETRGSLEYALRVKKIKNTVNKNTETKEVSALKADKMMLEEWMEKMKSLLSASDKAHEWAQLEQEMEVSRQLQAQ